MRRKEIVEWVDIAADAAALCLESAEVIGLRLGGAASGTPISVAEAWRMYSEKAVALAELQTLFLRGSLGRTPSESARRTLRHYRKKVALNRSRLRKSDR